MNNLPIGYSDFELGLDRTSAQDALYTQAKESVLEQLKGKYVSNWEMDELISQEILSIIGGEDYE